MRRAWATAVPFILLWTLAATVRGGDDRAWIGQQVIARRPGVAPRIGKRKVPGLPAQVYTVELAQGDWLWVGDGWILARDVVRWDEAVAWFTQQVRTRPTAFAYLSRGVARTETKDFEGLIADCTAALKLDRRMQAAYRYRAAGYTRRGQPARALADVQEAIRLGPATADLYRDRGCARCQLHDYPGALADLDYAVRLDAKDPLVYDVRGAVKTILGNLEQALKDANKAIELDPKNSRSLANRGWTYTLQGKYDAALADFDKAIGIDPDFAHVRVNRGDLWLLRGEAEKAIRDYDEAIRIDAGYDAAWRRRAIAHRKRGELEQAANDVEEAIRRNPRGAANYCERAQVHFARREYRETLDDANTAIRLDPKSDFGFACSGSAKSMLGDTTGAIADVTRAVQLAPKNGDRYLQRAELFSQTGDYRGALADYDAAMRLTPDDAYLYGLRATVRQLQGDAEGAQADLKKGIELAPEQAAMLTMMLAQAAERAGDHAAAIEIYKQVVADPSASRMQLTLSWVALAGIWAECSDAKFRDGRRALEAATKACELTDGKMTEALSALAAAHAECGDFAEAVRCETKALALSPEELAAAFGEEDFEPPPPSRMDMFQTRLECYRSGKRLYDVVEPMPRTPRELAAIEHSNRAVELEFKGDHAGALAEYDEAIRLAPQLACLYANRGNSRAFRDDPDGAIADMQKAIELGIADAQSWYLLGQLFEYSGRDREAIDAYQHALVEKQPPSEQARVYMSLAKLWAEPIDESIRDGRRALEAANQACELTDWKLPEALTALAAAHAECGDFEQAVRRIKQAIELPPPWDEGIQVYPGGSAAELERFRRQELNARLACYEAGKVFEVKYLAEPASLRPGGSGQEWLGQRVIARTAAVKLRLGPRALPIRAGEVFTVSRAQEGWLWVGRGWLRTSEAMTVPEAVAGYSQRSVVRMIERNYAGALADCNAAIKLKPGLPFQSQRAAIRQLLGDEEGAQADLKKAIELAPDCEALFLLQLGQALVMAGDERRALDTYSRALTAPGAGPAENKNIQLAMARIWAEARDKGLRDGRRALDAAKQACELSQWSSFDALSVLAASHAECGDFAEAVRWQTKAIELASQDESSGKMVCVGTTAAELRHNLEQHLASYRAGKRFEPRRASTRSKTAGGHTHSMRR